MTDLKFKAGDHVMVPMKVTGVEPSRPYPYRVELDGVEWLSEAALASATLIERPLAVGDRAIHDGLVTVIILAIDGDEAWVKASDNGDRYTVSLSELRRAEERG